MASDTVNPTRLRELLHYDPDTGIFTRKSNFTSRTYFGKKAGSPTSAGHLQLRVDSNRYLAHRLAWLYVNNAWPSGDIDHINGVRSDNRIANLRDVSRSVNMQNQRKAQIRTASKYLGAHRQQRGNGLVRYLAQICIEGRTIHIGSFDTPEEAHAAYLDAKRRLHPGCTI